MTKKYFCWVPTRKGIYHCCPKRLGQYVIACDSYAGAPAMQVADACEVFSMLDGEALDRVVEKYRPDIIVPEIEAIHY